MPVLHLDNLPREVYDRIQALAVANNRTLEAEAARLLQRG
jgi:hypothetical protein